MTDLTTGMMTCLVTPAVRQLALDYARSSDASELVDDREELIRWFQEQESPNGTVLDASASQEDALMIAVVAQAIYAEHRRVELDDSDQRAEEAVRALSRY